MKTIESIILESIKAKGFRQNFVAQKINISEHSLSLALNGKRAFKSIEFINLCLFLGLTLQDFEGCKIG